MRGVVFSFGVTLSADESRNCDGGSLAVPYVKNVYGAGTGDDNIFYIAQISAKSLTDPMFFESAGMRLFKLA